MPTNTDAIPISLRAPAHELDAIDRAAKRRGKSRTRYILDASYQEAQEDLLDHPLPPVDEKAYQAFLAALDTPPADNPRLRELFTTPAPWEK